MNLIEMGLQVTFCGIPVNISFWSLVIAAVFLIDSRKYISDIFPDRWHVSYWIAAVFAALAILISLVLHEGNHALAAYAVGEPIVEAGVSWWGAYVKPAHSMLEISPGAAIFIALAGPAANFILGFLMLGLVKIFKESLFENTLQYIGIMNFKLGILNMLPIIMLDGGKALYGLLSLFLPATATWTSISIIGFGSILYLLWRPKTHFSASMWFKRLAEEN